VFTEYLPISQILIHEARKKLLRTSTDSLIIGKLGVPVTVGEVGYLIERFKPLFPDRNLNPGTVRQSVIANWLNEKKLPMETVQLMVGHRWISTTLRYRQSNNEEKRLLINKLHPLR
jgi:site-specific recombinase XerD